MGATREIAEWAATVRYEDIPERVHDRTKAQFASVLGAIHAGRHSEAAQAALETTRSFGTPPEATVFATGERLGRLDAIFANAAYSVAFDFDDYLFAGHTGHSAVCASLAYGEHLGSSGRDVLAAAAVANEVGGRLGAALLLGPHNGQMWAYIHLLEGACAVGRLLGLDAGRIANAIGVAFTQPVYPLMPAFMGPDSKLLIPSSTTVEGAKAAEFAARGWTGSNVILEDRQGFLRKYNPNAFGWMLSGFGTAWVSDSLSYKVVPGCAYIDTAVDAMHEIFTSFEADHGRKPNADDVDDIHVSCGLFTMGMETFAQTYRSPDRLEPITVNFSVALSFGLMLTAGALAPEFLSHKHLDANREEIEAVASKVRLEQTGEMDRRASEASESGGFSLRSLISSSTPQSLDEASFEGYTMAFPAEVTFKTRDGKTYVASQDVPFGAAGRPWDETREAVREKFRANYPGDTGPALDAIERLVEASDIRELVSLLGP